MSRRQAVRRAGAVLLGANVLLVLLKGVVWITTGSTAVGAEAANSLIDSAYSLVVVVGLYYATKPPDEDHPHGHERIEPFVALAIALTAAVIGSLTVWQGITSIQTQAYQQQGAGVFGVGVLLIGVAVKLGLYAYCMRLAETYSTPALRAAGIDNRNDVLSASVALVGVIGGIIGVPILEPISACLVGVAILYAGYDIATENIPYLVGRVPSDEFVETVRSRAEGHPSVYGTHDIVPHYVGPEIDVSLHIEVEAGLTLEEAHEIESEVIQDIRAIDNVDDVFVHLDPRSLNEWKEEE